MSSPRQRQIVLIKNELRFIEVSNEDVFQRYKYFLSISVSFFCSFFLFHWHVFIRLLICFHCFLLFLFHSFLFSFCFSLFHFIFISPFLLFPSSFSFFSPILAFSLYFLYFLFITPFPSLFLYLSFYSLMFFLPCPF